MKITLGIRGDLRRDITPLLDEDSKIILMQELERDAFERTVEDLTLRASNMDGYFTEIFRYGTASTRYEVTVSEEMRTLFRGEIDNESIRFDAKELWVELNVFSMNHRFWDRAKRTRVNLCFTPDEKSIITMGVKELILRELSSGRVDAENQPLFQGDMFSDFTIADQYAYRQIRFYADTDDSLIGNNGKFANLDPSTTIFDLLTAMSVYYNAEFFINPETEEFTMNRRLSPTGHQGNLDGCVLDDSKIDVLYLDRSKYDYIYTMIAIAEPPSPLFDRFDYSSAGADFILHVNPTGKEKCFKYFLTCLINDTETMPSVPLMVNVPATKITTDDVGFTNVSAWDVRLTIPAGYPGTTKRYLYRTEALPSGSTQLEGPAIPIVSVAAGSPCLVTTTIPHYFSKGDTVKFTNTGSTPNLNGSYAVAEVKSDKSFTINIIIAIAGNRGTVKKIIGPGVVDLPNVYFLAEIDGNLPVSYRDGTEHYPRCDTSRVMKQASPLAISAWIGYDETYFPHQWKTPILDVEGGRNTPSGKIFDALPKLNFCSPNFPGQPNPYNLYDVFSFFTKDNELDKLTMQWENLLTTIRGISCKVKGINFRVGDEIGLSANLPFSDALDLHPRLLVKKAAIDLINEETELELISL
ncbi:MAG: hypothetical protein ACHQQQ_00055 [Bacteroidota bacterium]